MTEIIKVEEKDGVETVSARELHGFLDLSERLSKWFSRMLNYGFVEGVDYTPYQMVHPQNHQEITEYALTIDMAKELSMLARNDKGKEARRYFIEREKQAKKLETLLPDFTNPAIAARAWADEVEKKMIAESKVLEMTPKAEFYDQVTGSKTAIDVGQAAKILDIGIGRNTLFEILRAKGILMNDNTPYQSYIDRGYFRVIEQKYVTADGSTNISLKTVVYQKGLDFIRKALDDK